VEPEYFQWGSICHHYSEHRAVGRKEEDIIEEMYQDFEKITPPPTAEVLERFERFVALVPKVYDARLLKWYYEDQHYETVVTEQQFEMPLKDGWKLVGKIDGILRDTRTGELVLKELKTAARTGPTYWNRLALDGQIRTYLLAVQRVFGYPVTKVLYEVWKKPDAQQKVREGETADEWATRIGNIYLVKYKEQYERELLVVTQESIDEEFDAWIDFIPELEFHLDNAIYPKHHPGNRIGGCPFFRVCVHGEDSFAKNEFYTRDKQHPELAEETI
jgi:hypothetical protein